jgi:hypothetical protein
VIYVCDYDEVFKIVIGSESEPENLDDDPYQFLDSLPHSLGVYDHPPILESNGNTVSYNFVPTEDSVTVKCIIDEYETEIKFRILSGDWFAASFSKCGKYLMLAEPYGFELYEVS